MIYVGSPYTHHSSIVMDERARDVAKYTARLIGQGKLAYSPIAHGHMINGYLKEDPGWEYWKEHDIWMLVRCIQFHVLCLDGWEESVGLKAEIQVASNRLMPIEYIDEKHYSIRSEP